MPRPEALREVDGQQLNSAASMHEMDMPVALAGELDENDADADADHVAVVNQMAVGQETLELRAEEADYVDPNLQSPNAHGSTFAPPYLQDSEVTASANPTPARQDFMMSSMGRRTSAHPEFNMPSGIHSSHVSGLHPEESGDNHEFGARKSSYFG